MSYKIFANHAHVFPKEVKEKGTIDKLKELMDACEISKAVAFTSFPQQFEAEGIDENTIDWLYNQIKNDDSIIGFGVIDFRKDDIEDQIKHIYDCGFKGIKIHPAYQEINIVGEKAFRAFKMAEELGLFLSFHTGLHWHRIADYSTILYDEIGYNFPELNFSMEHVGGYSQFNDALLVMCNNKRHGQHIYAGWTSIDNNGGNGTWSLSDQQLLDLIYQTGEEVSIFGLDFPYNDIEDTKLAIERIKSLDITETAKAAILGGNLSRALNVEL